MGLTRSQCKALGIEHLFPSPRSDEAIIRELAGIKTVAPPTPRPRGPTKLETAFMEVLEAAKHDRYIAGWRYECIKLRLAGRTFYTPDFLTEPRWSNDNFTCIETKGPYAREDSIVKLKVAAELYPCFAWWLVRREGRHSWTVHPVTRTGIGRDPVVVPWISGGGG